MAAGLTVGAIGMATLALLHAGDGFALQLLPAEILWGLGMGGVSVPAFSTATLGMGQREAGVASAVAGTAQQIGASVGTALLNTIAAAATVAYLAARPHAPAAAPRSVERRGGEEGRSRGAADPLKKKKRIRE